MHLNWQVKHYHDLTLNEFHDIIALRLDVFVVEQDCPYLDLDGKDKKCYHLICRDGKGDVMATSRILPPGISYEYTAIGRVVINKKYRGQGIGHEMMERCIQFSQNEFGNSPIIISAQKHLEEYYGKHQFVSTGSEYLEDGIPHVEMKRSPQS
jgi:ElaA protein